MKRTKSKCRHWCLTSWVLSGLYQTPERILDSVSNRCLWACKGNFRAPKPKYPSKGNAQIKYITVYFYTDWDSHYYETSGRSVIKTPKPVTCWSSETRHAGYTTCWSDWLIALTSFTRTWFTNLYQSNINWQRYWHIVAGMERLTSYVCGWGYQLWY